MKILLVNPNLTQAVTDRVLQAAQAAARPGTELLAVLPAQIARLFTLEGGLKQLELPFPVGEFEVSLHWHPNSDSSAALRWFCQTVAGAIIDGQM